MGEGKEGKIVEVVDHYIQLRMVFSNVDEEEEIHTTIGELANHLCCTMRNMNLIMNKFMDQGWVRWSPQRGRGKTSVLVFCHPLLQAVQERFDRLLQGNKLEEAYVLASSMPFSLQEVLMQGLQGQFGLRSDQGARGRMDTLRIPQETAFETLDPTQAAMWGEVGIIAEVFDRLVQYNAERQVCEPSLAVAWESNQEGTEWTFYLHKGIRFHHGRILDAEDVRYTFERIVSDQGCPCRPLFGSIHRIETFDELTVRFVLRFPNYMFPDLMSSMNASILPRDIELDPMHPIGTGPYRLTRNHPKLLVMDVFPSHFRGRAFIDRVEIWQLPQSNLVESVIKQDLFPDGQAQSVQHEVQGGVYMTFNMRKEGPQQDIYFRQAVQQLMNPQEMVEELARTNIEAAYSLVRDKSEEKQESLEQIEQTHQLQQALKHTAPFAESSLTRASELLQRSSYAGQIMNVWVEEGEKMETDMNWFAHRCELIGLKVSVMPGNPVDAVYHDEFASCDLIYTGEVFDDHLTLSLLTMYTFQNTLLLIALDDQRKSELEHECRRVVMIQDSAERLRMLMTLEERLIHDAVLLPTYSFREEHAHHASLQDYRVVSFGMPDLRRLWVKRSPNTEEEKASYPAYIPLW
ncbi:ABC transporter substrate-binding protein [Paenibacillus sp. UMB7766-LJ446]|uniref:ABC transporter substrate-binding protein n=1 Tax=Paenibacillus sp. UMB7766-LJ446 TaxID=3046313 RepID=UPI00254C70FB|nr:ABC transporter substrate-binding protein [Paenibacillus sp. UMB7766-LJ446]MDK8189403.1 ABC transporter substrate-binding protein [Paenibacillus sp. UMB7766-LJ446]